MATIGLRTFTSDDIVAAEEIERAVYPQPWSTGVFADELGQDNRVYLALEVDGHLAGYGGLMLVVDEAHITTVVVAPQHRQGRLGTRLMMGLVDAAVDHGARSLTLEVRTSNLAAQALYRRFGMAPVGVRKQYYRDEDALIMWVHDIDTDDYAARLDAIREDLA
jgi:[ribosomal protein S18]-alanine N-acetyltransferase